MKWTLFSIISTCHASTVIGQQLRASSTENPWISLAKGVEYQAASFEGEAEPTASQLREAQRRALMSYTDQFVDGSETKYDEYSQAWRLLGLYVDCDNIQQQQRRLEDAGQGGNVQGCTRYLVWAAYVDLDYEGGGIGEYQYYDTETKKWNKSACNTHGNGRCAKMDCHLSSTKFRLLGFFKEDAPNDWFQQLFKHHGSCLWSSDDYTLMENYIDFWPNGCQKSSYSNSDGSYIYYAIKPVSGGRMDIGLYSDEYCSVDFTGKITTEQVLMDYYGNQNGQDDDGDSQMDFESLVETWNKLLDTYRVCQPCKTYSLTSSNSGQNRRKMEENDDVNGGYFVCNDANGDQNVNQCMKFKQQTDMTVASQSDLALAQQQRSLTKSNAAGLYQSRFSMWFSEWGMFTISVIIFVIGLSLFGFLTFTRIRRSSDASEPLLHKSVRSIRRNKKNAGSN